jgi:hypothetical protein
MKTIEYNNNNINNKKLISERKVFNRKNINSAFGVKVISLNSACNKNKNEKQNNYIINNNVINSNNKQKDFDSYFKKVKNNLKNEIKDKNNPLRNSHQYYIKEKMLIDNPNENIENNNLITESKRNSKFNIKMGTNFEFKFKKANSKELFTNNKIKKEKEKYGNYVTLDLFNKEKSTNINNEKKSKSANKDNIGNLVTNSKDKKINKNIKDISICNSYTLLDGVTKNKFPKFSLKNNLIQKSKISLNFK